MRKTEQSFSIAKQPPQPDEDVWITPQAEVILSGFPTRDAITRYLEKHPETLSGTCKSRLVITECPRKPTRDRNGKLIHKHTPEARAKISLAMRDIYSGGLSEEHKRKISDTKKKQDAEIREKVVFAEKWGRERWS